MLLKVLLDKNGHNPRRTAAPRIGGSVLLAVMIAP